MAGLDNGDLMDSYDKTHFDTLDLVGLLEPARMDERRTEAGEALLRELMLEEAKKLRASQERFLEALSVYAQHQADQFYEYRMQLLDEVPKQYPKYGTRVRLRDTSLTCVWYMNSFARNGERFTNEMARGFQGNASLKYNMRQFKGAEPEEMENIVYIEGKYALVRSTLESLRKIRSNIAELERRAIKMCDTKEF